MAGDLVPQEDPEIHDFGSLCISTRWLFNFFLVKRTLKQELQVKETSGKRDQGKFDQHALLHHQAVLHYTLPPLPLHLLLIIIILLLLLLIVLLLLLLKGGLESLQALPLLLQGLVRQALVSSSPIFQIIDKF